MRMFTTYELQEKTLDELTDLFTEVTVILAASDVGSGERRNALASLENICHAKASKLVYA